MEKEIPPLNCTEHPNLLLCYYCSSHDSIFCEKCKSELHGSCSTIQTTIDASKGVLEKDILNSLVLRISEARELLTITTDKLEDNISILSRQYNNIKQNIHTARQTISEYFDTLESELTTMVHERCIKRVEEKLVELERRKYTLEQWEDELQCAVRSDDEETIFLMTKILQGLQNDMDSYLTTIPKDTKTPYIRWTPIKTDRESVASFVGKISISECISTVQEPDTTRSEKISTPLLNSTYKKHDENSIGALDIQQESTAAQGLNGISTKTQQGWNELSSNVTVQKMDTVGVEVGLNEARGKSSDQRKRVAVTVLNGTSNVENMSTDKPMEKDNMEGTDKSSIAIAEEQYITDQVDTANQNSGLSHVSDELDDNVSMEIAKVNRIRGSAKSHERKDRTTSAKSKFEAIVLDKKSSAEVKKGDFLSNGMLLFLDKTNQHMFICNKEGKVKYKINLTYQPEDVTVVDDSKAVVTLGQKGIQTVNLDPIKKDMVHDVGGFCNGITSYRGQIIVSVDKKLRLLDDFGYTLRRIQHDGSASFVCSDKNGKIYYTDSKNHTVHCMAWYGIPVFTYSHKDLKCPMGIIVDTNFFIYVAGLESSNVQKLWPNGRYHSEFLSEKDDIYEPTSLAYNEKESEILIISENGQTIELYDLHGKIQH